MDSPFDPDAFSSEDSARYSHACADGRLLYYLGFWKTSALSSAVERLPYKQDVAGSIPASRTSPDLRSKLQARFYGRAVAAAANQRFQSSIAHVAHHPAVQSIGSTKFHGFDSRRFSKLSENVNLHEPEFLQAVTE